jgi:hypothetical protein
VTPARFQPLATKARSENVRVRAEMRLMLGSTRPNSPRGVLKAKAFAQRERLAEAALDGALKDGRLALRVIEAVDPPVEASVSVAVPDNEEAIRRLSWSELLALAEAHDAPAALPGP